jgi:hypothetical protein
MNRISVISRVNEKGELHLSLAVGVANANQEVQVTVEPVASATLTPEEWRAWVLSTAGKWQGDFERPEQGEYELREPLP